MGEGFPAVLGNLWLGQEEAQARLGGRGVARRLGSGCGLALPCRRAAEPGARQAARARCRALTACPRVPVLHLQAVASALLPKLEKSRSEVEQLLYEVVTLEVRHCCRAALLLCCRCSPRISHVRTACLGRSAPSSSGPAAAAALPIDSGAGTKGVSTDSAAAACCGPWLGAAGSTAAARGAAAPHAPPPLLPLAPTCTPGAAAAQRKRARSRHPAAQTLAVVPARCALQIRC